MPAPGWAISTCGSFWKIAATSITGMSCSTAEKEPSRLPCHVELDLVRQEERLVGGLRAALHDGHLQAVLLVGPVGDRLIEAAMLAFGQPVRAEGDLVERHRRPGKRQRRSAGGKADRDFRNMVMSLLLPIRFSLMQTAHLGAPQRRRKG